MCNWLNTNWKSVKSLICRNHWIPILTQKAAKKLQLKLLLFPMFYMVWKLKTYFMQKYVNNAVFSSLHNVDAENGKETPIETVTFPNALETAKTYFIQKYVNNFLLFLMSKKNFSESWMKEIVKHILLYILKFQIS
jgi:hypothetical protein